MTAPHFHTTDEAKKAIKNIEHNSDEFGPPTGIAGGSNKNMTTFTKNVNPSSADADDIKKRGL